MQRPLHSCTGAAKQPELALQTLDEQRTEQFQADPTLNKVSEWLQTPERRVLPATRLCDVMPGACLHGGTSALTMHPGTQSGDQPAMARSGDTAAYGSAHFCEALEALPPAAAARLVATGILQQQAAAQLGHSPAVQHATEGSSRAMKSQIRLSQTRKVDAALQQRRARISAGLRATEQAQKLGALQVDTTRSDAADVAYGANDDTATQLTDQEIRTGDAPVLENEPAGRLTINLKRPANRSGMGPTALAVRSLTHQRPQLPRSSRRQVRAVTGLDCVRHVCRHPACGV